jgi:hypothetical protein
MFLLDRKKLAQTLGRGTWEGRPPPSIPSLSQYREDNGWLRSAPKHGTFGPFQLGTSAPTRSYMTHPYLEPH